MILVPLFQRLGFGTVLGYLIAGILVGPSGFKLIDNTESILHFAELGVVILLFIIGLEIQPRRLWSMRRKLFGLGGLQVLLTSAIFSTIGFMFGIEPVTAMVLGFALSLSSTAFALQTLMERNQLNTEFGQGSFSTLLMQDLTAIPALIIIPILISKNPESVDLLRLGIFIPTFLIAAVLVNKYIMRPIFLMIASIKAREIFTAATFFIILGVAAIMVKFGLSAALGAFVAGVLLADSEYRHELEANIDPFKSLLMGLFFIAIGMGVNLGIIFKNPFLMFVLAFAYLAIKFCVIYGVSRLFKSSHENAKLTALNIAQGGEFAFVIFGLVLGAEGSHASLIASLTVIVTLSMALNPVFILLDSRISKRFRKGEEPQYDVINNESPEIIIAGFGRFGQVFGRMLRSQRIPFVAVDQDADQIQLLSKFGHKVYYGDATRMDILESAGAARAKYIILAIDNMDQSTEAAGKIREHFPHLKIFARARNRGHAFDLMDEGVVHIKRETIDSSLNFVEELLLSLGYEPEKAKNLVEKFRQHDLLLLKEQYKVRKDDKMFISVANQGAEQLNAVLSDESNQSLVEFNK
jgi:monovalent cation:proton antiporter-2 (CPA2) family protein